MNVKKNRTKNLHIPLTYYQGKTSRVLGINMLHIQVIQSGEIEQPKMLLEPQ